MIKTFLRSILRLLFRFRSFNENALRVPGPVLLLPNHVSWWDWLLIGVCLENDWRFVTSKVTAQVSWLHRLIMINRRTFPVDVNSPYAVKHMAEYLQQGGRLVLFPEGRISYTGSLMKLFDGTGFLLHRTGAKVVTAYIRGGERLPLSRNPNLKRLFPRVSVHFSEVLEPPTCEHASTSMARARLTGWLRERMVGQQFAVEMEFGAVTIPGAMQQAARLFAGKTVLQDATLQTVSYRRFLSGANLLAKQWRRLLGEQEERVGLLLPNVNAFPVTLFSLWSANKVPAVLNYTTGSPIMAACARVAGLKHIVTSKAFVQRAKLDIEPLAKVSIRFWYLEDIRQGISGPAKLVEMLKQWCYPRLSGADNGGHATPAVILFTSGSEGDPKAVELTHGNLLANVRQMSSIIDLLDSDRFFNALPLFHSFGLTVGLLLPMLRGMFVFLYVSPLHFRVVPSAFYELRCTVFFGTNTFLNGYSRKAHPYDFRTVRYLFAGAEKLQDATIMTWCRKFGVRVLEGYGATECSPCVTANTPMSPKHGSAGQFLPGIEY
ncbi:MAG TPA: AMP-binding protein, partial [Clostridia bacterium]|nr:AMP-binding protein [Clostridia bacterium]